MTGGPLDPAQGQQVLAAVLREQGLSQESATATETIAAWLAFARVPFLVPDVETSDQWAAPVLGRPGWIVLETGGTGPVSAPRR